jgi:hypothetical protein
MKYLAKKVKKMSEEDEEEKINEDFLPANVEYYLNQGP